MADAGAQGAASNGAKDAETRDPLAFVDQLEAVFAVLIAKARTDEAFAERLAQAVADPQTLRTSARARRDWAREAPDMDPRAVLEAAGEEALRAQLAQHTRRALYALVKAQGLQPVGASKLNKSQLISHILRAVQGADRLRGVFDY